jgi:aryl-alcohol dehydrogenase-like predicted oxidoreductase
MENNIAQSLNIKETIHRYWLENSGQRIAYGLGGGYLGSPVQDKAEFKEKIQTLELAYKLGFRYIDTARGYRDSESTIGAFIPSIPRESIFLATKFYLPKDGSPSKTVEYAKNCLAESLQKLNTHYLDLYQIHDSENLSLAFAEDGIFDFLLAAKAQGVIRHIGIGLRSHAVLEQALRHGGFDTILTYHDYHPFNQSAADLIDLANQLGAGVVLGSPLAGAHHHKLDLTDLRILAANLQFPLQNPLIDITLSGPSNHQELQANFNALQAEVDRSLWHLWRT